MRIFQNLTGRKLHLYKSLDTLKILTFWEILKTKNAFLLDFDYKEGKKYSDSEKYDIEQTWLRLYDEFFVLRDSSKSRMQLIKAFDELNLLGRINAIKDNIQCLEALKNYVGLLPDKQIFEYEQQIYKVVTKIDKKIKPKHFDGIDANITNLDKVLKSYINRYNQQFKNRNEAVKDEIKNVYDIVANAESWLERNININDMVVSHWLAIEKQIEQKRKAQDKKRLKNG